MRRFGAIWAGQLVTLVGNVVLRFGFVVHAWSSGRRASEVVLLSLCALLPQVLLGPTAGAVVDRRGRRTILLLTNAGGLAVVGALVAVHHAGLLGLPVVYAAVTAMGAIAAFNYPALAAAVPLLVPKPHLQRANGLLAGARSAAEVLGPGISAGLLAARGIAAVLAVSAASYLAALLAVAAVRIAEPPRTRSAGRGTRLATESLDGLRHLMAHPSLRALIGIVFAVNLVTVFGFAVVQPMVLARTGDDAAALATVLTSMGCGGIAGGLLLAAWGGPRSRIRGILLGVAGMCLTAQIAFAAVRGVPAWSATIFVGALLLPMVNGSIQAIVQTKVPAQRQGRVFGAVLFVSQLATPAALLSSGLLADHVFEPQAAAGTGVVARLAPLTGTSPGSGMATMLLLSGACGVALAVWGLAYRPLRDLDALVPDVPPATAAAPGRPATVDGQCVHERFEVWADRTPQAYAVRCGEVRLTYRELDTRADQLAGALAAAGAGGSLVGIHLERDADLVVAVLAALKAGAGYVILDPQYPPARLAGMAEAAGIEVVVARSTSQARAHGLTARCVPVDAKSAPLLRGAGGARPDDLACVMFTSGSTGRPKAVAAPHRAIVDTLTGQSYYSFDPAAVWLQAAPLSWDACVLELWGALLSGAECVLYPGTRPDPLTIGQVVAEYGITTMYLSSSLFAVVVDEHPDALAGVRELIVGGEPLPPGHLGRALRRFPRLRIRNGYGPVEAMVFVSTHAAGAADAEAAVVPIGRPLAGKRAYVLDERLHRVPSGGAGELYAAGAGLAHGYLGRPDLTAERFVADPFGPPGERMYRTGDLVRLRADGLLEFIGRVDAQVKVRGFRVELGEVEATLERHPAIDRAAVVADTSGHGEVRLVAYLVPHRGESCDPAQVRDWLAGTLPEFMVPAAYVTLPRLPLTPNGKLDRAALPRPQTTGAGAGRPPATAVENTLCGIVAEVLGLPKVGVDDNFFELGGDSLRVARLITRVRAATGATLSVRAVFEHPTVSALAGQLAGSGPAAAAAAATPQAPATPENQAAPDAPATPKDQAAPENQAAGGNQAVPGAEVTPENQVAPAGGRALSYPQRRLWVLDQLNPGVAYTMPILFRLPGTVDVDRLREALREVVRRHEALRTVFPSDTGEPVARVIPAGDVEPEHVTVPVHPGELDLRVAEAARYRFDLAGEIPFRSVVFTDARTGTPLALLLVMHHIAVDGWSLAPLARDLSLAYQRPGLSEPEPPAAPPDPGSEGLDFWRTALDGLPQPLPLPRNPVVAPGPEAGYVRRDLDASVHSALLRLAHRHRATLFMVLHAALCLVLRRAGAGDDIVVGAPVAGRTGDDLEERVGFFVNLVVLRTDLSGAPTVADLLDRTRAADLAAFAHQDVPFEQVVAALNPVRRPGWHPLVDVVLALQNNTPATLTLPGHASRMEVVRTGAARFQLLIDITDEYRPDGAPDGLAITVEHQAEVIDDDVARWLADALVQVLRALPESASDPIDAIGRLDPPPRPATAAPAPPAIPGRYTPPATDLQRRLAAAWAELLDIERVGIHDDFFRLGGTSLRAIRLAARIAREEGLPLTAAQLFAAPTVAQLATLLEGICAGAVPAVSPIRRAPRTRPRQEAASAGGGADRWT